MLLTHESDNFSLSRTVKYLAISLYLLSIFSLVYGHFSLILTCLLVIPYGISDIVNKKITKSDDLNFFQRDFNFFLLNGSYNMNKSF